MKKLTFLLIAATFGINCGAPATNTATANKPANSNSAANTSSAVNTNSAANTVSQANTAAANNSTGELNLDFEVVNKTGYPIKKLYVGPTATKEWLPEHEVLQGRSLADGATMDIVFHPKQKAAKWDIMVEWTDGSPSEQWLDLDLTTIEKVTLKYDRATDKTSAEIE